MTDENRRIILNGIFYDGSSEKEMKHLSDMFPNNHVLVHMVIPGEAHVHLLPAEGDENNESKEH